MRLLDCPLSSQIGDGPTDRSHQYEGDTGVSHVSEGRARAARKVVGRGGFGGKTKGKSRAKTAKGKGRALVGKGLATSRAGKSAQLNRDTVKKLTPKQVNDRVASRRKKATRATSGGKARTSSILRKARAANSGRARPLPLGQ